MNLLFFPAVLFMLLFVVMGGRLSRRITSGRLLLAGGMVMAAAVMALPAVLFAAYYGHLLDSTGWFYRFRAVPYSELTASGVGLATGLVIGLILHGIKRGLSRGFAGSVSGLLLFGTLLLLFVPYAKPLIAPLRIAFQEQWRDGICLQSTPSTCGPASAATLLRRFGRTASERELAQECYSSGSGTENWYLVRALRHRGLRIEIRLTSPQPAALPFPSIAGTQLGGRGGTGHFITLLGQIEGRLLIGDPVGGRSLLTSDELRSRYYLTGFFLVASDPGHETAAMQHRAERASARDTLPPEASHNLHRQT